MRQVPRGVAEARKGAPSARTNTGKKTASKGSSAAVANRGIKKEYLKSRDACKVTFKLPGIAAPKAQRVSLVGDFNSWDIHASPMKRLKSGDFAITIDLKPGKEYQFRYLIDDAKWENDWSADKYFRSPYGDSDNSVVLV